MIRTVIICISLLWPIAAHAQSGSVSTALRAVESFNEQVRIVLKDLEQSTEVSAFDKRSTEETQKVIAAIKRIRWSEGPSKRRFQRLYDTLKTYTGTEIDSLTELGKGLSPGQKSAINDSTKSLSSFRQEALDRLEKTRPMELKAAEGKKPRPVPVIDRSPYEEETYRGRGMWER